MVTYWNICPEMLCKLHPWRHRKPIEQSPEQLNVTLEFTLLWAEWLQRSLPGKLFWDCINPFCTTVILFTHPHLLMTSWFSLPGPCCVFPAHIKLLESSERSGHGRRHSKVQLPSPPHTFFKPNIFTILYLYLAQNKGIVLNIFSYR